jgi:hypothetical protein
MTVQNSLDRMLTAIAATLRQTETTDTYSAAQLAAAAELLDNLAPRVEWNRRMLLDVVEHARPVIQAALAQAGQHELPLARALGDVDDPLQQRDSYLAAVAEIAEWIGGAGDPSRARTALVAFLAWQVGSERGLTRSGSE